MPASMSSPLRRASEADYATREKLCSPPWRRWLVLACLAINALWVSPTRVAAAGSELDIPPALFFGPRLRVAGARAELATGQTLRAFFPLPMRAYRVSGWRWQRAASARFGPETMAATVHWGPSYPILLDDVGRFLRACVQLAVARDIVSWYCTPPLGPVTAPRPGSQAAATLAVPPALFFGPRPQMDGARAELTVGQGLMASWPGSLDAYRASRWRWRRAASPQPLPQDVETVTSLAAHNNEYEIRTRDAGHFLSACLHLAVARDIASEYCTPFLGPVLYTEAPPCAAAGEHPLAATARPAEADLPPLRVAPATGALRLLPALDGRRWHEPVDLLPWPAGGWAVAERAGRILRHRPDQTPCLLLDLTAAIGPLGTENGLLSLALDPQFPTAPFLYVYYTRGTRAARSLHSRLARFPVADGLLRREAEVALLETAPSGAAMHFGGALGFGPDGLLYLGIGDRRAPAQAPRLDSLLGKILRLDVRQATRARPYRIPAANPWRGQPGARPEAYARGFRNPWRLAFDPRDGALWVADVGGSHREEVNRVQAGADYGWPLWEGDLCSGDPAACAARGAAPIATYSREHEPGSCAVIGGVVYRGAALPGLDGAYLFGDHCSGRVWTLTPRAGGGWRMRQVLQLPPGLRLLAFAAADEEVYLLVQDGIYGAVLQLAPA